MVADTMVGVSLVEHTSLIHITTSLKAINPSISSRVLRKFRKN
jgi:hypothetical protein